MFNKEQIKKFYPEAENLMIEPMLINKGSDILLKQACESGKYFGQLKKDGAFYQFVKTEHYTYLFGRTVSKTTGILTEKINNVPHIQNALQELPPNTILVGEIYYPNGTSKNTVSIMGCLPTKAIERQNGSYGYIHYYIHDILMFNGVNFIIAKTGAWNRYQILCKIWDKYNLNQYDFLELAESWEDNLYSRIGDSLAAGEEGMVIKAKEGIYEPGKRPTTNLKAKQVDFVDAIIIGFKEPNKEYDGKEIENWQYWIDPEDENYINGVEYKYPIGLHYSSFKVDDENEFRPVTKAYYMGWTNARIVLGAYDTNGHIVEIGTIHSGISDEMKKDMTENPQNYLNKVVKIQCMSLDKKEKTIRHGFFKGVRDDKEIFDCTVEDIFS